MNTANSKIDIFDIEDIMQKSENISRLSSVLESYLDYNHQDELRGAFACLKNEMYILREECKKLYNTAFDKQTSDD